MAENKYDGFPKFFSKDGVPNRVANKPVDEVNLVSRGYKQVETKAAQKVADEAGDTTPPDADKAKQAKPGSKPTN